MAEATNARAGNVRPLAHAGGRTCARPGCPAPARSTLSFVYESRQVRLVGLRTEAEPATYDLCGPHADRTSPPYGWTLVDERPPEQAAGRLAGFDDEQRTARVLKAALHAVPDDPPDSPRHAPPPPASAPEQPPQPAAAQHLQEGERELVVAELAALGEAAEPPAEAADPPGEAPSEVAGTPEPRPVLAVRGGAPAPQPPASPEDRAAPPQPARGAPAADPGVARSW